jgi:hypothetical protein
VIKKIGSALARAWRGLARKQRAGPVHQALLRQRRRRAHLQALPSRPDSAGRRCRSS